MTPSPAKEHFCLLVGFVSIILGSTDLEKFILYEYEVHLTNNRKHGKAGDRAQEQREAGREHRQNGKHHRVEKADSSGATPCHWRPRNGALAQDLEGSYWISNGHCGDFLSFAAHFSLRPSWELSRQKSQAAGARSTSSRARHRHERTGTRARTNRV